MTVETTLLFDREAAMDRVDQDIELLQELVEVFSEEYPGFLNSISEALQKQDAHKLERASHSIKSALGNLGAMKGFELARTLENMGRAGEIEGAAALVQQLQDTVTAFRSAFSEFIESQGQGGHR